MNCTLAMLMSNVDAVTEYYEYEIIVNLNRNCNVITNPMIRSMIKK